jgi:hypothetical protein
MSRIHVDVFDHGSFMHEVSELLEVILGRPVSQLEDWRRLISDARDKVLAQPVAEECHCEACWLRKHSATK